MLRMGEKEEPCGPTPEYIFWEGSLWQGHGYQVVRVQWCGGFIRGDGRDACKRHRDLTCLAEVPSRGFMEEMALA